MLDSFFALIPGGQLVAGGVAALLGAVVVYFKGRSDGQAKNAEKVLKRADSGRKGASEAKEDLREGRAPDQIVRENDNAWD